MGPARFIGFCFLVFAAFGAGYHYRNLSDAEPFLAYARPAAVEEACEVPATATGPSAEYCAILTMPRSLVPFLERLKRNRLAKDVVITPATVRNDQGRITAVAKSGPAAANFAGDRDAQPDQTEIEKKPRKENSALGALAVYFLAGSRRQESP